MEVVVMSKRRTELQKEVVEALVSSKAVNIEAVGSVLAKYGARAALTGDALGVIIHWRVWDICIPPFYVERAAVLDSRQFAEGAAEEK
jgi:hypothetical protein